jgi:hypothetical protein
MTHTQLPQATEERRRTQPFRSLVAPGRQGILGPTV